MKYITLILLVLVSFTVNSATDKDISNLQVTRNLTSMPLAFTENQGQWDEKVRFRANAGGATMWFTSDGAYYQFTRRIAVGQEPRDPDIDSKSLQEMGAPPLAVGLDHEPDSIETMMIKASFVGTNSHPRMVGDDIMEYKCNYFLGNDPTQWRTDVPNYRAVVYHRSNPDPALPSSMDP